MRKTLTTAALLLALSYPALAGEIATPGSPTPPPPPSASVFQGPTDGTTPNGEIQTTGATSTPGAPDILTQTVLDLLALLPSLL